MTYELLCGHPPHVLDGDALENARRICEEEPPPPSSRTVVAREVWRDGHPVLVAPDEIARLRSSDPRRLRRRLTGDLDSIVAKALASDPERRYRSMEQLSEDLKRHLAGRPVRARRATFAYQAERFLTRNRHRLLVAGLVVVALVGAGATWIRNAREISRLAAEQRRAEEETRTAEHQSVVLTDSERLYRRVLALRLRVYGPDDEDVATTLRSLGTVLYLKGELAAAEPLLRRSLGIRRRFYGERSPRTAAVLSSLGRVLHAEERLEEAEAALAEALSIREERLGDAHPHVAISRKDLAVVLFDLGEDATAEVLWSRAMAVLRASKAADSWEIAEAESHLGARLAARGRVAEAEVCLERSHETLRRLRGEGAIMTRLAWERLARRRASGKRDRPAHHARARIRSVLEAEEGRQEPSATWFCGLTSKGPVKTT